MYRVLCIDDEPDLLQIAKLFLERSKEFSVDVFTSAQDALNSGKVQSCDAIVADYQMPVMDGIVFLKAVRELDQEVPFILFTGRGREEVVIEAINNGADFYMQKGGAPSVQFAELAHKLRQAIARRQAERSLVESEKRLSDIINFLPDATFAIDQSGTVIAWNRAIEEMTGIPASDMIGKGNYEYGIPFYGIRRPILVDLIFESDENISRFYSNITRDGSTLTAETDLPQPKGKQIHVLAKASPLYNRQGVIAGAIESIRDVTQRERDAERLARKTKTLSIINKIIQTSTLRHSVDDPIKTVLHSALDLLHFQAGGVYFVDDELKTARIVYSENLSPDFLCEVDNVDISQPPYEALFCRGQPVVTENLDTVLPRAAVASGFCSVASIPIMSQDIVIGALNVASTKRAVVSPDDLDVLVTIGQELGNALTRMKAEIALRESEENLRNIVENAPEAIYIQTNLRFRYLNKAALRLFGATSADQLLGEYTYDRIHPACHEVIRERVKSLTVDLQPVGQLEEVYLRLDGTPVDVEVTAVPFQYRGEHGALIMFRDITERKKSQEYLRESEERYRGLFENTSVAVFRTRLDGSIETVNPAFARLLGYETPEEVISVVPDIRKIYLFPGLRDTLWGILADQGAAKDFELALRRKNGSTVWVSVNVRAIRSDGNGEVIGLDGLAVDITEQKNAEAALRQSEERFRSLIESSPVPVALSREGCIVYTNSALASLIGITDPGSLQGRNLLDFIAPECRDQAAGYLTARQRGEAVPKSYEAIGLRADGTRFPYEINVALIHLSDGPVVMAFIADITGRKQAEQAIRDSNRKINLLTSITRHDVANQVAILRGFAKIAEMNNPDPATTYHLGKIDAAASTILRQIEFTKTYQELGMHEAAWIGIEGIVRKLNPESARLISTCRDIEIFADPMLEKVFFNLVDNAVRHGERVTEIRVCCEQDKDGMVIVVCDDGIGVPDERKKIIFEHGYGTHTGFGLFLAREILAITGITIEETGVSGKGARFEMRVPPDGFRFAVKTKPTG